MNERPTLLVPVEVQAFYVTKTSAGQPGQRVLGATSEFHKLPYMKDSSAINGGPYTSHKVVARAFGHSGTEPKPGVRVHWMLPDAHTVGEIKDDEIEFEHVPNRWLVVRMVARSGESPHFTKSWIVEGDRLVYEDDSEQKASGRTSVPARIDHKHRPPRIKPFAWLGRVYEAEKWPGETVCDRHELTAAGFGETEFTAYVPNSDGVFSLHDSLKGLTLAEGEDLSYFVIGWYHGEGDPLRKGSLAEALEENRWSLNSRLDADAPSPCSTLYYGAVVGVSEASAAAASSPEVPGVVAVGASEGEAVSALIANLAKKPELERQLNALQWNLLSTHGHYEVEEYREAQQQAGFWSDAAPIEWSLRPDVQDEKQPTPVPSKIAKQLEGLNEAQEKCHRKEEEIAARRWQLYSDHCKLQFARYGGGSSKDTSYQKLRKKERDGKVSYYVRVIADALEKDSAVDLQDEVRKRVEVLKKTLVEEKVEYNLFSHPGPRYWRPNDPVLLIVGDSARPPERSHGDGRFSSDGRLRCRLSDETLTPRSARGRFPGELLSSKLAARLKESGAPPQEIAALLEEARLCDRERAETLEKAGTLNAREFKGEPPCPLAWRPHHQDWSPLLLHWKAALSVFKKISPKGGSSSKDYERSWITDRFLLKGPSLEYANGRAPEKAPKDYYGGTPLSYGARSTLGHHIEKLIALTQDSDLKKDLEKLVKDYGEWPVVSQALEGFHEALLMRWLALQMDVADPLADLFDKLYDSKDPLLKRCVGDANTHGPLPNNWFNPIRAGLLKLTRLRLVDVWGRFHDQPKSLKPVVAEGLRPPGTVPPGELGQIFLLPRLPQSSRLHLRWRRLSPLADAHEDALLESPACGWFIRNLLDRSLMVYDDRGAAKGELVLGADRLLWRNAPMTPDPKRSIEEAMEGVDPSLKSCVLGLWAGGLAYVNEVLDCLEGAVATRDAGSSVQGGDPWFIGRRLMLARVEIDLELRQLPALEQGYWEMVNAIKQERYRHEERITTGFTRVEFPVRLGNSAHGSDGLAGYFVDDAYDKFYSYAAKSDAGRIVNPDKINQPIRVVAEGNPKHQRFATLLFDPEAKIHVATGIHPVKELDVPAHLYEKIRKRMQPTFLVSPLISAGVEDGKYTQTIDEDLALPLPAAASHRWQWVERLNKEWVEIPRKRIGTVDEKASKSLYPLSIREGWLKLGPKPKVG